MAAQDLHLWSSNERQLAGSLRFAVGDESVNYRRIPTGDLENVRIFSDSGIRTLGGVKRFSTSVPCSLQWSSSENLQRIEEQSVALKLKQLQS